ncbi:MULTISPECIES: LexA family transcriptional regulator [unclassified Thioalkalivibrio]|uniref:LexA family protein n=1 Tax=unclassified Thioalkalivibrio TaxID=2621013 RepID=UPI001E65DA1A|nr:MULTISPECIES: S24 family peptidase [unclassified Thioalkalivibrio]
MRAFLEQFNPNEDAYLQIVQLVDQIGVSSSQQTALDHPDHVEDILDEYYPGWRDGEYSQCTLGAAESQAALSAIPTVQNARCIPVIDYVEAGSPREIVDAYECGDGHRHEWLDPASAEALGPHTFALEIRGRSMEPDFRESEIIIVDPDAPVRPGDIVVARVNGDAEATVKKYRDRGRDSQGHPVYELVPLNPDYATITIDSGNPGSLIGPVVQHKRNLR